MSLLEELGLTNRFESICMPRLTALAVCCRFL